MCISWIRSEVWAGITIARSAMILELAPIAAQKRHGANALGARGLESDAKILGVTARRKPDEQIPLAAGHLFGKAHCVTVGAAVAAGKKVAAAAIGIDEELTELLAFLELCGVGRELRERGLGFA